MRQGAIASDVLRLCYGANVMIQATVAFECPPQCGETDVRRAVVAALAHGGVSHAAVTVVFLDDADSAGVHGEFFGDESPTDVMTFPLGGCGTAADPLTGEIVVGAEHAARVAGELGRDAGEEAILYVVHGALHLCGMDDREAAGRAEMRAAERAVLQSMGVEPHYFD